MTVKNCRKSPDNTASSFALKVRKSDGKLPEHLSMISGKDKNANVGSRTVACMKGHDRRQRLAMTRMM